MLTTTITHVVSRNQALGHPARIRILSVLRDGRLCIGELQGLTGLAVSTVSRHVSELERTGLLEQHKQGRWVWCELATEPRVQRVLDCVWHQLEADPTLERDRLRAQRLRVHRGEAGCSARVDACGDEHTGQQPKETTVSREVE